MTEDFGDQLEDLAEDLEQQRGATEQDQRRFDAAMETIEAEVEHCTNNSLLLPSGAMLQGQSEDLDMRNSDLERQMLDLQH